MNLIKYALKLLAIMALLCAVSCGKKKYPPDYFYSDTQVISLCKAISNNDEANIDALLKEGVDINTVGKDGMTPLLWALKAKNKAIYEMVLRKGGDPNIKITAKSAMGESVMSLVCRMKDIDYLKITLKYVNKSSKIQLKKSALSYALIGINDSTLERVKLLVEAGADINCKAETGVEKGMPPLISAAALNQYDIVYYLLQERADPLLKADPIIIPSLSSKKDSGLSLVYLIEQSNELMSRKGNQYPYLLKCAQLLKDKGIKVDVSKPQKYPEK